MIPSPLRVMRSRSSGKSAVVPMGASAEVLPPEQACLATIAIERLLGVDGRLGAQITRNGCKSGVSRQLCCDLDQN